MFKITRRVTTALLGLAVLAPATLLAQAKYPSKTITIIAGTQAGTGGDNAVRTLAVKLSASLGQPIVVESVPGAGGVVAASRGAKAPADGYTLSAIPSWIMTIRPHIEQKLPYDPFRDFVSIAQVSSFPTVLYVNPNVPANNLQEFIALAKKNPGKFTYASPGVGSAQHLAMEQLKVLTGIDLLHVPFQGSTQAAVESVAGRVDSGFNGISTVGPFIAQGKLRALAWAEGERYQTLPDLPTIAEAGVPAFKYEVSMQLFGPKGMPTEIVNLLNEEIQKAVRDPDLRANWAAAGLVGSTANAATIDAAVRAEWTRNQATVQKLGLRAD